MQFGLTTEKFYYNSNKKYYLISFKVKERERISS